MAIAARKPPCIESVKLTMHCRFNTNFDRMRLADDKNYVCSEIQSASHILDHYTVLAPISNITNTTNENLIKCLCNSSF